jgi:LacI family gluconate utilization system Gnt-I transcriptional repressor
MHDVAKEAGVSPQTVSRVIRSPNMVAENTRKKVEAAINRLNYIFDYAASDLASNQSRFVAAIIPRISFSLYENTVSTLSSELLAAGYQLLLGNTEFSLVSEEAAIRTFLGRRPEALMVIGLNHTEKAHDLMRNASIPIVQTMELCPSPIDTVVGYSNHDASYELTQLLLTKGYSSIAYVGVTGEARNSQRRQGYLDAVALTGVPPIVVEHSYRLSYEGMGAKGLNDVLDANADTDAVVFANDSLAVGAIFECQRRKIDIPGEIAIAGFGDFEISSHINPGLTTVHIRSHDIGRSVAQVIIARLNGSDPLPKVIDVGYDIIERASI